MSHTVWNNLEKDILEALKLADVWGLNIYDLIEELEVVPKTTLIDSLNRLIKLGKVKRTKSSKLNQFGYPARGRPITYFKLLHD